MQQLLLHTQIIYSLNIQHCCPVSYSTDVRIVDTLIGCWGVDWQRDNEIEANKGYVKLKRNRCRKIECITIPYSNDSKWLLGLSLLLLIYLQNICGEWDWKSGNEIEAKLGFVRLDRSMYRKMH